MTTDSTIEQFLGLVLHSAVVIVLLVFSLNFAVKAGERGFYPHDQSIVFDGSYRMLSGQVPYRDFVMLFTPAAFWLQVVFFKLFGISHFSLLMSAVFLNVLATLLSVLLLRQLFPQQRSVSYLAGFLTAIWFSPPFGTLWMDHAAHFFSLFSVLMALYALPREADRKPLSLLFLVSGCAAFMSFAGKQNIGLFMLPLSPIVIALALMPHWKKVLEGIGLFVAGFVVAAAFFFLWLLLVSSPSAFWHYAIVTAGRLGLQRLVGDFWGLVLVFLFGRGPLFERFVTSLLVILSISLLVFYVRDRRLTGYSSPELMLPPLICIYFALAQRVLIQTTMNQPQNGFPLTGVIVAIGAGMLFRLLNSENPRTKQFIDGFKPLTRRDVRVIVISVVLLSTLYVSVAGMKISLNRDVQDSVRGSSFPTYLTQSRLLSLKWGDPTTIGGTDVTERDVDNILTYLKKSGKNFFIFPDFTIFYGVAGVPSPQPLLYFTPGETYPQEGDRTLDSLVVSGLKTNQVEIAVLEEKSVSDATKVLESFPLLESYLDENFVKVGKIGIFHIFKKPEYGYHHTNGRRIKST
jgi:hypothetical protein